MKRIMRDAMAVLKQNSIEVISVSQNRHYVFTLKMPSGRERKLTMSETPKDSTTALWRFTADVSKLLKEETCASI